VGHAETRYAPTLVSTGNREVESVALNMPAVSARVQTPSMSTCRGLQTAQMGTQTAKGVTQGTATRGQSLRGNGTARRSLKLQRLAQDGVAE
jgi:hypothetical protein